LVPEKILQNRNCNSQNRNAKTKIQKSKKQKIKFLGNRCLHYTQNQTFNEATAMSVLCQNQK